MTEIVSNSNLYKTPSDEIIRNRREFYGLWRRCDDETGTWLNRVQVLINRCEFPPVLSREYLLIDRFVCELNPNAREFIQSVDTWTLEKLKEYFFDQKIVPNNRVSVNISIDETIEQHQQQLPSPLPLSEFALECKFEDDSCSTNSEIADEDYSFIEIQNESQTLAEEDLSMTNSPIDIANEVLFSAESESNSDIINELLIDGMECEFENYEYSVSDDIDVIDTGDENGINPLDHSLEMEVLNSNTNKHQSSPHNTAAMRHANNQRQLGYFKSNNAMMPLFDIIRPHVCKVCKMSFKYLGSMEQHLKKHEQISSTNAGDRINSTNSSAKITEPIASMPPEEEQSIEIPTPEAPKETESIGLISIAGVSSMPLPQIKQKRPKKTGKRQGKKVAVTIGHDLQGNPIVTYRKPINGPIVHLPKHIQTPELQQLKVPAIIPANPIQIPKIIRTMNPAVITTKPIQTSELLQTTVPAAIPAKPHQSAQFVITNKDNLPKTTINSSTDETIATPSTRPHKQNTSTTNRSQQTKSLKQYVYKIIPRTEY